MDGRLLLVCAVLLVFAAPAWSDASPKRRALIHLRSAAVAGQTQGTQASPSPPVAPNTKGRGRGKGKHRRASPPPPHTAPPPPTSVQPAKVVGKRGDGFWSVKGTNFVDANGNIVQFSGVSWSGLETPNACVNGLWVHSIPEHLDMMKKVGFNLIRLPFAGETLKASTKPTTNIYGRNPGLKGKSSLDIMDIIINECNKRDIKVILDYHRMHLTVSNEIGTWWDANTPESVWIDNWVALAKRYKGNPTVIGADLYNEVHPGPGFPPGAPYWVAPNNFTTDVVNREKYNFRSATLRVIKAIQAVEPNWLLFMEGHHTYWWGGDCSALLGAPITAPANKLAYTAHEYGPYVYQQQWFKDAKFPSNLPGLFSSKWGLVKEKGIAPLWVGEFGSFLPPNNTDLNYRERTAFITLIDYIKKLDVPWTIWNWTPESKDTGGILLDNNNWSLNEEKLNLLKKIMHPGFGPSPKA